jgi:hypothetical protein
MAWCSPGASPDLDVEREALTHRVRPEETAGARRFDRVPQAGLRQRVLAADVDEALVGLARVAHHGERLDQGVRVGLHEHPVLEGARL